MTCERGGRRAWIGCNDGFIRVWNLDPAQGGEVGRLEDHKSCVFSLALSPNESLLVSGGSDRIVRLWNVHTGKVLWRGEGHTGDIDAVVYNAAYKLIMSTGGDRTVRFWEEATGKEATTWKVENALATLAVSADGKRMVMAGHTPAIRLWEAEKEDRIYEGHKEIRLRSRDSDQEYVRVHYSVLFCADGERFVSTGEDGLANVWSVRARTPIATFRTTHGIWRCALSGNNEALATGHSDGVVRVWKMPGGAAPAEP
jgi:WD40 repeat protein